MSSSLLLFLSLSSLPSPPLSALPPCSLPRPSLSITHSPLTLLSLSLPPPLPIHFVPLYQFGSNFVRVSISESGRFDGPESGSLWGVDPGSEVLVRPPATTMALKDFITLAGTQNRDTKEIFYVEYLALTQYLGEVNMTVTPYCAALHMFPASQIFFIFPLLCISLKVRLLLFTVILQSL